MPFAEQPTLRYLDLRPKGPLGGRGNAVSPMPTYRLFMLANGVEFDDELVSFEEWGSSEKQRMKESGEQPAGHLPVLKVGDKCYSEHIAICRFIARQVELYGKDAELDYETDAAADASEEWRATYALTMFDKEGSPKLKDYQDKRSGLYEMMESYYKQRTTKDGPYLVAGDKPGFGDACVFNMVRDDGVVYGKVDLAPYPNLKAMYQACDAVPAVRQWIEGWEAREV